MHPRARTTAPDPDAGALGPARGPDQARVTRRLTVHIYGYWLTDPRAFHARFKHDLQTFGQTWSAATRVTSLSTEAHQAGWSAYVSGPNWRTRTDYRILRLDELIATKQCKSLAVRIWLGLLGLLDFVISPAFLRYVRLNLPYAILTAFPILWAVAVGSLCVAAGSLLAADRDGPAAFLAAAATGIAAVMASVEPLHIIELLDNWAFSSILVRRLEADIEGCLNANASDLIAAMRSGAYDEVVLIGHSLGAVLAVHLADRIARREADARDAACPRTGTQAEPVPVGAPAAPAFGLLTLGSSLLKIGLHPAASGIRRATRVVASTPWIVWADYQSRLDVMNFYGLDPVSAMNIQAPHAPIVRTAPFSRMLSPEAYRGLWLNLFRTHNQYVRACTRRCAYDYFMYACGPFFFSDLATCETGATARVNTDGRLT